MTSAQKKVFKKQAMDAIMAVLPNEIAEETRFIRVSDNEVMIRVLMIGHNPEYFHLSIKGSF